MTLNIDPEFERLIPPLTPSEQAALRDALKTQGRAVNPIIVWRGIIVDGHNRYRLCQELGIPFDIQNIDLPDRDAVKAWMVKHQSSRRNLSRDQILVLHLLHGQPAPLGCTSTEITRAREAITAGHGTAILSGRLTLRTAWNKIHPPAPRPPRGPSAKPAIPEGHELAGVSTLTGPDGDLKAEWNKTRVAGAEEPPQSIPENFQLKRASVMQRGDGTTTIQWSTWEPEKVAQWEATKAAIVEHVNTYVRAVEPAPAITAADADQITLYNLGDPHVGLLAWAPEVGESFDLKIAERELCQCFAMLVDRAPPTKRAIVTNLGDFWHAQGADQLTPKGRNKLDVDGRKGKVGQVGLAILHTLIDSALRKHEAVDFRSLPGNHDPDDAFWIAAEVRAWYRNEPRVTVHDAFNPYQFERFGNCLFGWCHGDGAKLEALGEIMSVDAREHWGTTEHHYWHVGHVHHYQGKELRGCTVETHNTLAGRDAWHHHSGYRSKRMLRVHVYHREWGLDSVGVVGVERVRAALLRKGIAA